jgi:hypothetical protein
MKQFKSLSLILAIIISPIVGVVSKRDFEERRTKLVSSCTSHWAYDSLESQSSTLHLSRCDIQGISEEYSSELLKHISNSCDLNKKPVK